MKDEFNNLLIVVVNVEHRRTLLQHWWQEDKEGLNSGHLRALDNTYTNTAHFIENTTCQNYYLSKLTVKQTGKNSKGSSKAFFILDWFWVWSFSNDCAWNNIQFSNLAAGIETMIQEGTSVDFTTTCGIIGLSTRF